MRANAGTVGVASRSLLRHRPRRGRSPTRAVCRS